MTDLFDDEPKPNSPEDLGTFTPRRERRKPPPHDVAHPEHPSQRFENQLEDGEEAPTSWNTATTDLGIQHMRTFLEWCDGKGIDRAGQTVGTLYMGLNAHSLDNFRWLCTQLGRVGVDRLPPAAAMSKAILARDVSLLYSEA